MANSMLPQYNTMTFCDVWGTENDFRTDYLANPLKGVSASDPDNLTIVYYLLVARYGNNPIANRDVNQWKLKIFSVIFQYGPTWEKRLEIQNTLRNLDEDDLLAGATQIYNHAFNPSTNPEMDAFDPLKYINDQNASHFTRAKIDAYALLWDLLRTDVSEQFLLQFKKCFKIFVSPERPLLYITEDDEED